jgi:predicted Kef-type K+ transport protein
MQVETEKLLTVTNFAKQKGLTRQHVYRLIVAGSLTSIVIDGIVFVLTDDKAENLQRQRKEKVKKI